METEKTEELPKMRNRLELLLEGAAHPGDSGTSPIQPPPWLDRERFYRARDIFHKYFFSIFFAHLAGLMLIVHIPSMVGPLLSTGNSSTLICLFRRYLGTLQHVRRWYEGDVWNPSDAAHKSIVQVRNMHKRVGTRMNDQLKTNAGVPVPSNPAQTTVTTSIGVPEPPRPTAPQAGATGSGSSSESDTVGGCCPGGGAVYISQLDMALTQFAFLGLIIMFPKKIGIQCSREDLECLIHFWRGIGYLLGIDDRFNVCEGNYDETVAWCKDILNGCMKPAIQASKPESKSMSRNIIKAMNSFIIFLSFEALARFWYELLEIPIEFAMGIYEKTGYWLMKLTFTRLLKYRVFHKIFNYLLIVAIKHTLSSRDYYEQKICTNSNKNSKG